MGPRPAPERLHAPCVAAVSSGPPASGWAQIARYSDGSSTQYCRSQYADHGWPAEVERLGGWRHRKDEGQCGRRERAYPPEGRVRPCQYRSERIVPRAIDEDHREVARDQRHETECPGLIIGGQEPQGGAVDEQCGDETGDTERGAFENH